MAYRFSGFLARSPLPMPNRMPEGAVWRRIDAPFHGIGVRLEPKMGRALTTAEAEALTAELGIDAASEWLYLHYVCWAGQVDSIRGFGVRNGDRIPFAESSKWPETRETYLRLMGAFGVSDKDALAFPAFQRGFWGEV